MYLTMAFAGGSRPGQVARALWPVQILAASSRSSLACLPLLADAAHSQLKVPDRVAGFILPLSNSTFRLNRALSNPGGAAARWSPRRPPPEQTAR